MKKTIGVIFYVMAVIGLIGSFGNNPGGRAPAVIGYFLGTVVSVLLFAGAGTFFFSLDKSALASPLKGYRKRKKLAPVSVFYVVYFIFISAGTSLRAAWISFSCLMVFAFVLGYYFVPFFACRRALKDVDLEKYLETDDFKPIAEGSHIYANENAILLHKLFIPIPIDRIAEVVKKEIKLFGLVLESDILIKFDNGKKFDFASKEYEALKEYLDSRK